MREKELKALVKALIIQTRFDGIIPSPKAYGDRDRYEREERELNQEVEETLDTFRILLEEDTENE